MTNTSFGCHWFVSGQDSSSSLLAAYDHDVPQADRIDSSSTEASADLNTLVDQQATKPITGNIGHFGHNVTAPYRNP